MVKIKDYFEVTDHFCKIDPKSIFNTIDDILDLDWRFLDIHIISYIDEVNYTITFKKSFGLTNEDTLKELSSKFINIKSPVVVNLYNLLDKSRPAELNVKIKIEAILRSLHTEIKNNNLENIFLTFLIDYNSYQNYKSNIFNNDIKIKISPENTRYFKQSTDFFKPELLERFLRDLNYNNTCLMEFWNSTKITTIKENFQLFSKMHSKK